MSDAIYDETAGSAYPFAAIVIESDRLFTLRNQIFIEYVQHFEKRHVLVYLGVFVTNHLPDMRGALLSPDVENQFHLICSSVARDERTRIPAVLCSGSELCPHLHTPRRRHN